VRRLKHSSSKAGAKKVHREQLIIEAHRQYVDLVDDYVQRAKASMGVLNVLDMGTMAQLMVIDGYIAHAERQIDQIRRRVLEGDPIAHQEKVFSIFEEHTEWISKGKAGVPQVLGLGVCVLEDQYGFILHHRVTNRTLVWMKNASSAHTTAILFLPIFLLSNQEIFSFFILSCYLFFRHDKSTIDQKLDQFMARVFIIVSLKL